MRICYYFLLICYFCQKWMIQHYWHGLLTSVSLDFEFRLGNSTHCLAQHSTFILSQRIQQSRSCSGLSASKSEGCVSQTHVGRGMYATVIWEVELVELFGLFFSFLLIVYLFIASQLTVFHVNTD